MAEAAMNGVEYAAYSRKFDEMLWKVWSDYEGKTTMLGGDDFPEMKREDVVEHSNDIKEEWSHIPEEMIIRLVSALQDAEARLEAKQYVDDRRTDEKK